MSSYNNIQKIKYTKTPSDVVALNEYILFENSHAKEKYVVFRFANNVNQRLFEIRFEVLQYDADNRLIEKSVVVHKDFTADANGLFVPNAKLKVNFECRSLEVNLEEAVFDRVIWSGGTFADNPYRFETYAETVAKPATSPVPEVKKQPVAAKKKNSLSFNIRNIFRKNKSVFPAVFNVILCAIFVALVVASTFYFKQVTGAFGVEGFIVKESSAGYVSILGYNGGEDNVEIPATLGEYTVTKIAGGAFKGSSATSVKIKTERPLVIETDAFKGCKKLTSVTSSSLGTVTVMEGAFKDCTALTEFVVPAAQLCAKCFDGADGIKFLAFYSVLYSGGRLLDLFVGLNSITLKHLRIAVMPNDPAFTAGVKLG